MSQAFSQSLDSTITQLDDKIAKVVVDKKGDVTIVFRDGREAQVFYGLTGALDGQIPLMQLENSCGYELKPANCKVLARYENYRVQLQWTKNPNAKKLGQVVEKYYPDQPNDVSKIQEDIFTSPITYQKTFLEPRKGQFRYELSCDQTQWIENARTSDKLSLFSSVSNEIMFTNDETDVDENQSLSEIFNAQFKLNERNNYELMTYAYSHSSFGSADPFLSNQVIHFVYEKDKKSCHVSFAANAGELIAQVRKLTESSAPNQNKKLLKKMGELRSSEIYSLISEILNSKVDSELNLQRYR